mmetsp:Transcript_30929/g.50030  ORF Transcript_30929/g.50030 Transcript_30929/m.50030 type:complete len:445 (-) Transcript_30929:319-1653(-)
MHRVWRRRTYFLLLSLFIALTEAYAERPFEKNCIRDDKPSSVAFNAQTKRIFSLNIYESSVSSFGIDFSRESVFVNEIFSRTTALRIFNDGFVYFSWSNGISRFDPARNALRIEHLAYVFEPQDFVVGASRLFAVTETNVYIFDLTTDKTKLLSIPSRAAPLSSIAYRDDEHIFVMDRSGNVIHITTTGHDRIVARVSSDEVGLHVMSGGALSSYSADGNMRRIFLLGDMTSLSGPVVQVLPELSALRAACLAYTNDLPSQEQADSIALWLWLGVGILMIMLFLCLSYQLCRHIDIDARFSILSRDSFTARTLLIGHSPIDYGSISKPQDIPCKAQESSSVSPWEGLETPPQLCCSITHQLMQEPVVCADGHTYERIAIERWLKEHCSSPLTGKTLKSKIMFPNYNLMSQIKEFQENRSRLSAEMQKKQSEDLSDPIITAPAVA